MNFKKLFSMFFLTIFLVSPIFSTTSVFAMEDYEEEEIFVNPTTPLKSTRQHQLTCPPSVSKVPQDVPNYCKEIISTLNNGKITEALNLFKTFYKKIPSTLKNSNRQRTKNQKDGAFEKALREDALNYHKSLFLCLAMSLTTAAIENTDSTIDPSNLISGIKFNSNLSEISLKLKIKDQEKPYLIKFEISEKENTPSHQELGEYEQKVIDPAQQWNKQFHIDTTISITQSESDAPLTDISEGYKSNNFFKNTINALVPASSDSLTIKLPLSKDLSKPAATSIEQTESPNIKKRLESIFNAIPKNQRVHLEQYAQFIIFSLINFMGSYICDAEVITGEGRADLIIKTERDGKPAISIIELKRDQNAEIAIDQIETNKYMNSFDMPVNFIGIAVKGLDKEKVSIECKTKIKDPKLLITPSSDSLQILSNIPKPRSNAKNIAIKAAEAVDKAKKTEPTSDSDAKSIMDFEQAFKKLQDEYTEEIESQLAAAASTSEAPKPTENKSKEKRKVSKKTSPQKTKKQKKDSSTDDTK